MAFTVLLFLGSAAFLWQAAQLPPPAGNAPIGPRTFPVIIGAAMVVVTLYLLWKSFRSRVTTAVAEESDTLVVVPLEEDETSISDWLAVAVVLGSLLALCILFVPVGFVLSITIFTFGLSTFFAPRMWLANLIVSVVVSVSLFLLFTKVLEITLPDGLLSGLL